MKPSIGIAIKEEIKKDNFDEITIKYKIDDIKDSKKLQIFGDEFVRNNINLCKIVINKK